MHHQTLDMMTTHTRHNSCSVGTGIEREGQLRMRRTKQNGCNDVGIERSRQLKLQKIKQESYTLTPSNEVHCHHWSSSFGCTNHLQLCVQYHTLKIMTTHRRHNSCRVSTGTERGGQLGVRRIWQEGCNNVGKSTKRSLRLRVLQKIMACYSLTTTEISTHSQLSETPVFH